MMMLVQVTRLIAHDVQMRVDLPAANAGRVGDYTWKSEVLPFAASGIAPGMEKAALWRPQIIQISVKAPGGKTFQVSTVKLRRG